MESTASLEQRLTLLEQSNHSLQDKVAKLAEENAELKEILNKEKTLKMKESDAKTKPVTNDLEMQLEILVKNLIGESILAANVELCKETRNEGSNVCSYVGKLDNITKIDNQIQQSASQEYQNFNENFIKKITELEQADVYLQETNKIMNEKLSYIEAIVNQSQVSNENTRKQLLNVQKSLTEIENDLMQVTTAFKNAKLLANDAAGEHEHQGSHRMSSEENTTDFYVNTKHFVSFITHIKIWCQSCNNNIIQLSYRNLQEKKKEILK